MATAKCFKCGGSAIADTFEQARNMINHAVGLSRGIKCGDSYGRVKEIKPENIPNPKPTSTETPKQTEIPKQTETPKPVTSETPKAETLEAKPDISEKQREKKTQTKESKKQIPS